MFRIFKMFAHDVKVLSHDVIQVFKGWNHENEKVTITSIQFNDSIDKMVEKEMAQLKSIKDEKEKKEMSKYKKQITSLDELYQVIDALEVLNKKYLIRKLVQKNEFIPSGGKYLRNIWYVEEVE
ncbi:hypothetical protein ACXI9T_004209 [Bacillus paranthracis]